MTTFEDIIRQVAARLNETAREVNADKPDGHWVVFALPKGEAEIERNVALIRRAVARDATWTKALLDQPLPQPDPEELSAIAHAAAVGAMFLAAGQFAAFKTFATSHMYCALGCAMVSLATPSKHADEMERHLNAEAN